MSRRSRDRKGREPATFSAFGAFNVCAGASRPGSDSVVEDIQNKLQDVRNPMGAMGVLLREMDLETEGELEGETPLAAGGPRQTTSAYRLLHLSLLAKT